MVGRRLQYLPQRRRANDCSRTSFARLSDRFCRCGSVVQTRYRNLVPASAWHTTSTFVLVHTCSTGKYHLGFPLPASQRRGRATFGGAGRGLSYSELVHTVRQYGGFEEALAVWGGNKQTARSPHHPEWMAEEASSFIRRAAARRRRFFLYYAPTVPHTPFALPDSLLANASLTPAGLIDDGRLVSWQRARSALLSRLRGLGLSCRDYTECISHGYAGSEGRDNAAYREVRRRRAHFGIWGERTEGEAASGIGARGGHPTEDWPDVCRDLCTACCHERPVDRA